MTSTVLDKVTSALDVAFGYDKNVEVGPIALFWPDPDRQWESLLPLLRAHRRIVALGDLDPDRGAGPAYWVRCVIAGTLEIESSSADPVVVYMPGVSRDSFRGGDLDQPTILPLVGIQHRSNWFLHPNGRDWTVRGFLMNSSIGLGLNIAGDEATSAALIASLPLLADYSVDRLEGKNIDASYLNGLLTPDPTRLLLDWLDNPVKARNALSDERWKAFVQQCEENQSFNPEREGELAGARKLGEAQGVWRVVWDRFAEAPGDYSGVIDRLRQVQPDELIPARPEGWPGLAENAESLLRQALVRVAEESPSSARSRIRALELEHSARRKYVWADLGLTPLAFAIEHLAAVAELTSDAIPGRSVEEIQDWYLEQGWKSDRSAIWAVAEVAGQADLEAVAKALDAVYRPWLDENARVLQAAVGPLANAGTYETGPLPTPASGEVLVFVDGLRMDVGHMLVSALGDSGHVVEAGVARAALPTVTQTSKPTLVPIDQSLLCGATDLDARRAPDGPLANVQTLRSMMTASKVQVLANDEVGDPSGVAWTETGQIDHRGHELGVMVAHEISSEVARIARRIDSLLDAGWSQVTVVTDHGWLFLPGGLPKNADLPAATTEVKKGRCARIKSGADIGDFPTVPWHWDSHVRIAIAQGISCFEVNKSYEHGGVSPQECLVPRLSVTRGQRTLTVGASIASLRWRGLTLVVELSGLPDGTTVDLRRVVGDPVTTIVERVEIVSGAGKAILLVGDEDMEGEAVDLAVSAPDGTLLLQRGVTVGQNK